MEAFEPGGIESGTRHVDAESGSNLRREHAEPLCERGRNRGERGKGRALRGSGFSKFTAFFSALGNVEWTWGFQRSEFRDRLQMGRQVENDSWNVFPCAPPPPSPHAMGDTQPRTFKLSPSALLSFPVNIPPSEHTHPRSQSTNSAGSAIPHRA